MKKKKLIRQSEFANQMGITRQRVSWVIKKGTIPVNKDGLIDLIKAKMILEDNRTTISKMKNIKKALESDKTLQGIMINCMQSVCSHDKCKYSHGKIDQQISA